MAPALLSSPETSSPPVARIRDVLGLHFDSREGSPFWIGRARTLAIQADDIRSIDDLALFGPMDEEAMRTRPLSDFIPRKVLEQGQPLIPSESGGATGVPKLVVFTEQEFREGFLVPFVRVARRIGFPQGGRWLFVGPTGPHIIGRAARHLALAMGAGEPFTVDFDPRWHRRLLPDSVARRRHIAHIVEQALHVMRRVEISVLFVTPSILAALTPHLTSAQRLAIRGIHFGGQTLEPGPRAEFQREYPRAVQISGYGNSLVGVCMEVPRSGHSGLSFHAAPPRHIVRLLADPLQSLTQTVAPGARGRALVHRLDESYLILNLVERDEATRLAVFSDAEELGLEGEGIGDPAPAQCGPAPSGGIY